MQRLVFAKSRGSPTSLLPICSKCHAQCCRYGSPMVLPKERDRILQFCKKDFFARKGDYYIIPQEPCPFLTENDRCSIEQVKPVDCRAFPVGTIVEGGRIAYAIAEDCPAKYLLTESFLTHAKSLLEQMTEKQQRDLAELNESQGISFGQDNTPFGMEIVLDMYGCDRALLTRRSLGRYFEWLRRESGVDTSEGPIFSPADRDRGGQEVVSAMQFVGNSCIIVYAANVLGTVYVNVISRGKIDVKSIEILSESFFKAEKTVLRVLERK